ncbi:MAG: hypothetical protein AB8B55_12340 [Mariniblastus sp.]
MLVLFLLFFVLLASAGAYWVYQSAQTIPEFYQAALSLDEEVADVEGDEFEKRVLNLQNDARSKSEWQAIFTEAQVNGWIASDMPEKFPDSLPQIVEDPRVVMLPQNLKLAMRVKSGRFEGILIASTDVFCTEDGRIGVRIKTVSVGVLPIPIAQFADRIADAIRSAGVDVEWTETEGDPVALLKLPKDFFEFEGVHARPTGIEIEEGKVILSGETKEEP